MNTEPKPLTLAQARAEIERFHQVNLDEQAVCPNETFERAYYNGAVDLGREVLELLSRVKEPDEDDRAALWLRDECGWFIARWGSDPQRWKVAHIDDDNVQTISPANEARRLGWEG